VSLNFRQKNQRTQLIPVVLKLVTSTVNKGDTAKAAKVVLQSPTVSTASVLPSTTSSLASGTVVLASQAAGTVTIKNKQTSNPIDKPIDNAAVTTTENLVQSDSKAEIVIPAVTTTENLVQGDSKAEIVIPAVTEVAIVKQVTSNTTEPTSTQPIPATRDVPLPEALPEVIETDVVEAEVIAVAEISNDIDKVDPQEVLHTVIPGENLYSISVEYNVKLNTLRKWNNISEKNKIQIGDKLYVVDPQTVKNIND